jgi:uncharacterized membrane protein
MTRSRRINFIFLAALFFGLAACIALSSVVQDQKAFAVGGFISLGVAAAGFALAPWGDEP